ncbi:MAG: S-formylglutathione hydrolase [Gammaproteobacteria bacterium]|nr:S-formylglutathione hydrolase [Gammaproteobacteria bacterium]MBQ0838357.1 S-formylglutathione hydrolase [Gammaproteobacteria bacterium]
MQKLSSHQCFGGQQLRFSHPSSRLNCDMSFSVFLPPNTDNKALPVLYWLSGLTCNDENFVTKAAGQRYASEHGIVLVAPDTSPRGDGVADDPEGAYDLGLGAGFYLNATRQPWAEHYQMYDYIVDELPALLAANFAIDSTRASIAGHSMGGHGALTIALRNPQRFRSVSAFAPICSPTNSPWGQKAFANYLGDNRDEWQQYDALHLLTQSESCPPILIDQGGADDFLTEQLGTDLLEKACAERASKGQAYPINIRRQAGYDHSYFFIASFIGEHIAFHAQHLK